MGELTLKEDKKPSGKPASDSESLRFDHRIYAHLEESHGVFLGEAHHHPAMRQALVHLLPALKARGVTTLSIELPQDTIDAMLKAPSTAEWMKKHEGIDHKKEPQAMCELVRAAHASGIKVLGHEMPRPAEDFGKALSNCMKTYPEEGAKLKKSMADLKASGKAFDDDALMSIISRVYSESKNPDFKKAMVTLRDNYSPTATEGVKRRNIFSADYIKKNKREGNIIILGGAEHGQGVSREGEKAEGLNIRLGLPSIVVNIFGNEGAVGTTTEAGNIHKVVLPENLKTMMQDLKANSWPPQSGIPILPLEKQRNEKPQR